MLFCCLRRNVETSCHKYFAVVSHYNKLQRLLPAVSVTTCRTVVRRRCIDNTWPVASLTACSVARYWLRIAICPTCMRRPRWGGVSIGILPCRRTEKLEQCGYPMLKQFRRYGYSFWPNVRMWQIDGQMDTAWHLRPHLHSIVRQKRVYVCVCVF